MYFKGYSLQGREKLLCALVFAQPSKNERIEKIPTFSSNLIYLIQILYLLSEKQSCFLFLQKKREKIRNGKIQQNGQVHQLLSIQGRKGALKKSDSNKG